MVNNESAKTEREVPFLFYESGTRKPAKFHIGSEPHTAKSALKKFPKLIGLLQPKRRIKKKSVEDKFRRFFRRGRLKKEDFVVDAPLFLESRQALDGSFKEFVCDDPIIENYDLPSVFELLTESIKNVEAKRWNGGIARVLLRRV